MFLSLVIRQIYVFITDPISPNTNSISYEGYHRLQEQLKINMKLEKDASLEQERLRILAGKNLY